jgi:hypothetical protein
MWCIQRIDPEYRKRMYDVLDLYEEKYDPKRPVICLDEKAKQIITDKIMPIPMTPGCSEMYDYEYIRNGTANIFVAVDFKAGKRVTKVTTAIPVLNKNTCNRRSKILIVRNHFYLY